MRVFPGEHKQSLIVQTELAEHFQLCEAMHNFWLGHDKDRWMAACKLPRTVSNVATLLDVQTSRLFRSIVEECSRGEGHNASILCRSLFETFVAQNFVLAKRVLIVVYPVLDKSTGKQKIDRMGQPVFGAKEPSKKQKYDCKQWLSRELRANLYMAHQWSGDEQDVEELSEQPGTKRQWRRVKRQLASICPRDWEKDIGPEWTSILRHRPFTYSGLSVRTLASVLNRALVRWYDTIYHWQSRSTHASDGMKHLEITDGERARATYVSSVNEVNQPLRAALGLFLMNMNVVQRSLCLGPDVDITYESLKRKLDRL